MPFNDAAKNDGLKSGTGGGMAGIITHVGIHTAVDPGTGTNANAGEATGGSPAYARQAVTWGTPSAGAVNNSGGLTFDVPAGSYWAFTLWNGSSGNTNNFRGYLPFGGSVRGYGAVNAAGVTGDTIYSGAHGLANGDRVLVFNVFAESLPTGLTEGTTYFVVGATTDSFQLSLTSGGGAVDITAVGELYFQKFVVETFGAQGQITVAANQLILDLTAM